MSGLTNEGFTPLSYQEVVDRISTKLDAFSPGIDLSAESPDGQLVEIMSYEISQAWTQLAQVFNSYNPNLATGAALRNLGLLSGLPYGGATRSQVDVDLTGVAGTVVPIGSLVADADGNEFSTSFDAIIPATVQVQAMVSGTVNVSINLVNVLVTNITGWTGVDNPADGRIGSLAQTELQFRNFRNKAVFRNFVGVADTISSRLLESLGIQQASVVNNDTLITLDDGTPPQSIHVTIGETFVGTTDEDIAQVILTTKGLGCSTFGTTTVTINDSQGNPHDVSFTKATPVTVSMEIDITFLSSDFSGAVDRMTADLLTHINSLDADEDVVWSRLFGIITPYAKAQINSLELSTDGTTFSAANAQIGANNYAFSETADIVITVTNQ